MALTQVKKKREREIEGSKRDRKRRKNMGKKGR